MAKMYFPQYARGRKEGIYLIVGKSILEHMRKISGVEIDSECGGKGICGMDMVRVEEGSEYLNDLTDSEKKFLKQGKLKKGQRLACQAKVTDDKKGIIVFISNFGRYTILTDTIKRDIKLNPCVFKKKNKVFYNEGQELGSYKGKIYGLAIDVGTTTIVMQVINLETGENIGNPVACKNPQIAYGNDVISRIGYTMNNENGLAELQNAVVEGVNESLSELEKELGIKSGEVKENIYDVVVVGNSTMRRIFFGQDVKTLGVIPFEPLDKNSVIKKATHLGLDINPDALVYGAPLIGGHAGADCLADIVAAGIYKNTEVSMIIDIGTNGEVVVGNNNLILTASCAAGGAYEGYQISCGVGAIAGAITEVKIDDSKIRYKTLDNKPALGICGSGAIDLLSELLKSKIMNKKGRIKNPFYLDDRVYITQDDINQLGIAKAGLRTDQDLLIKYYGTTIDKISKIYLAGAFGNYMNIDNAIAIGLLPDADKSKFIRLGNGALAGAIDMLLSRKIRNDSETLVKLITHTKPNEIEGEKFQYMVADNIYFNQK